MLRCCEEQEVFLELEKQAFEAGKKFVIGVDEVGLGCLAGVVTVAAVCICASFPDLSVFARNFDSKKLSPTKRRILVKLIENGLLDNYCVVSATVGQINSMNILKATHMAMLSAIAAVQSKLCLARTEGEVFVDGINRVGGAKPIVSGDRKSTAIGLASVLAKVSRDNHMSQMALLYPEYGFEMHKGYPTEKHRQAIELYGLTPIHRLKFCRKWG